MKNIGFTNELSYFEISSSILQMKKNSIRNFYFVKLL